MCQHVGLNLAPESFWVHWTLNYLAFPVPCKDATQKSKFQLCNQTVMIREFVSQLFWFFIKGSFFLAGGAASCILLTNSCPLVYYHACPILLYALVLLYLSRCNNMTLLLSPYVRFYTDGFLQCFPIHQQSILLKISKDWSFCERIFIAGRFLVFTHLLAYFEREALVFLVYVLLVCSSN